MKEKNLFDILENAENDSMDRLIDKCPEISDEQLDKILVMSERKFNMKKMDSNKTMRDTITMTGNDFVEGVEHVKKPAWINPLSMAASLILIAGIAIGSTAIINRKGHAPIEESSFTPAAAVTTTTVTYASEVTSSGKSGSAVKTTGKADSTVTTAVQATTAVKNDTAVSVDNDFIAPFVGIWTYQESAGNYAIENGAKNIATVDIHEDATFTYVDYEGNSYEGTIRNEDEEIGGTVIKKLNFYADGEFRFGGHYTYTETDVDTIELGNGGMARLVRGMFSSPANRVTTGVDAWGFTGEWTFFTSDLSSKIGTITFESNGRYTYTDIHGNTTTGLADVNAKAHSDAVYVTLTGDEGGGFKGYYDAPADMIVFTDNPTCLIRGEYAAAIENGTKVNNSMRALAGKWNYEVADGNTTVDISKKNNGVIDIHIDGTYDYTAPDGTVSHGTVDTGYEEIGGANLETIRFYENDSLKFSGYQTEKDVISIGNGGMARLVRE
ncbi:MAG: hypothetical protein K5979_01455 [Ruminococcus sp.]|nr:hypothetical protein [Ruminococcus sp.]